MCVCVCFLSSPSHIAFKTHRFYSSPSHLCRSLATSFYQFFFFFRITFFPASHNTPSIFLVSWFHWFFSTTLSTHSSLHFFSFFEEGGYCSDLHLTHTLTHSYILHYNLVPVFSPNSPTHFSFSLVSHAFLLSFSYWFLWPRGNQQTCGLCVKMCSPGFVLVWCDLVLQQCI